MGPKETIQLDIWDYLSKYDWDESRKQSLGRVPQAKFRASPSGVIESGM